MAYTKTVWVNNQAPAINAENLNKIEDGIYDSVRYADAQTLTDAQKTQARANIAAAPAGYGLGEGNSMFINDGNNAVLGGNYVWGSIGTNLPFTYGCMNVVVRGGGSLIQTAYSEAYPGCSAQRKCTDGTWGEWEWINPPMQLGVEYRTTERYLGKPVYCKLVDFGTLPNNATKNVSLNIDNPEYLVGIWGNVDKNFNIPSNNFGGGIVEDSIVTIWTNLLSVYISTNGDRSIQSAIILVKYTKTTD